MGACAFRQTCPCRWECIVPWFDPANPLRDAGPTIDQTARDEAQRANIRIETVNERLGALETWQAKANNEMIDTGGLARKNEVAINQLQTDTRVHYTDNARHKAPRTSDNTEADSG